MSPLLLLELLKSVPACKSSKAEAELGKDRERKGADGPCRELASRHELPFLSRKAAFSERQRSPTRHSNWPTLFLARRLRSSEFVWRLGLSNESGARLILSSYLSPSLSRARHRPSPLQPDLLPSPTSPVAFVSRAQHARAMARRLPRCPLSVSLLGLPILLNLGFPSPATEGHESTAQGRHGRIPTRPDTQLLGHCSHRRELAPAVEMTEARKSALTSHRTERLPARQEHALGSTARVDRDDPGREGGR